MKLNQQKFQDDVYTSRPAARSANPTTPKPHCNNQAINADGTVHKQGVKAEGELQQPKASTPKAWCTSKASRPKANCNNQGINAEGVR